LDVKSLKGDVEGHFCGGVQKSARKKKKKNSVGAKTKGKGGGDTVNGTAVERRH